MCSCECPPTRGELMVRAISLSSQVIDAKRAWKELRGKKRPKGPGSPSEKEWQALRDKTELNASMTQASWLRAEWELRKAFPNHPGV
jgi:hypothetical protein